MLNPMAPSQHSDNVRADAELVRAVVSGLRLDRGRLSPCAGTGGSKREESGSEIQEKNRRMARQSVIAMNNHLPGGRLTWSGSGLDPEYFWISGMT